MKCKLIIIVVCLIISSTAYSQFSWGVGGAFGSKAAFDGSLFYFKEGVGIGIKSIYDLSETTALQGGFNYYLSTKIGSATVNQMVLAVDFNYNFVSDESMKAYFLAGLNYTGWHAEVGQREGDSYGSGVHTGIGLRINQFLLEVRYEFKKVIKDPVMDLDHPSQIVGTVVYLFNQNK